MPPRRADRVHGVLVIDKPSGLSSQDVVTKVRLGLHVRSAGHTGTLDPLATGVLPICLGQATKIAQWLLAGDKRYLGECELGLTSDTLDITGAVVRRAEVATVERAAVEAALAALAASREQVPPMHSAIQHGGQRLHELAREGIEVERAPRPIRIDALELLAIDGPRLRFAIACSKGTYVRALVRDLGERLGTGACLTALRRTASGPFTEADALPLADVNRATATARLIPTARALGLPAVAVAADRVADVINGVEARLAAYADGFADGDRFQLVGPGGDVLAVAERRAGRTYLHRVLTYGDSA